MGYEEMDLSDGLASKLVEGEGRECSMLTRRKVMMNICGDQSLCVPREIGAEFERNYAHDRRHTVIGTRIVTTFLQLGPWNVAEKKLELFGGFFSLSLALSQLRNLE